MSDYQARKARALELQREKEEDLRRELAAKAARDKQMAKDEEERRKRQDAAAREARRLELMRANEALNKKANGEDSKSKDMEYDPFAEDEWPKAAPVKHTVKPATSRAAGSSNAVPRASSSKQSHPGPSARPTTSKSRNLNARDKDKASPPPLGRKERAARAFAQQAKRSAGDSLFSVRSLVDSRESSSASPGPSRLPAHPRPTNKSAPTIAVHGIGMANGLKRNTGPTAGHADGKGKGSVRDQLKAQFSTEGLRKLCPDRATRDRRSIEEIQRDIKAKKGGSEAVSPVPLTRSDRDRDRERDRGRGRDSPSSLASNPIKKTSPDKLGKVTSSAKPPRRDDNASRIRPPTSSAVPRKRRVSTSSSSSSGSSSPTSKWRHDPYRRSPPPRLNERSSQIDVSAEIQALFRRPGRPTRKYDDDMSDGSSDMEAGLRDVEVEERRAAKIARREDELAEREERERKEAKERRKKEMMRGRA